MVEKAGLKQESGLNLHKLVWKEKMLAFVVCAVLFTTGCALPGWMSAIPLRLSL